MQNKMLKNFFNLERNLGEEFALVKKGKTKIYQATFVIL